MALSFAAAHISVIIVSSLLELAVLMASALEADGLWEYWTVLVRKICVSVHGFVDAGEISVFAFGWRDEYPCLALTVLVYGTPCPCSSTCQDIAGSESLSRGRRQWRWRRWWLHYKGFPANVSKA